MPFQFPWRAVVLSLVVVAFGCKKQQPESTSSTKDVGGALATTSYDTVTSVIPPPFNTIFNTFDDYLTNAVNSSIQASAFSDLADQIKQLIASNGGLPSNIWVQSDDVATLVRQLRNLDADLTAINSYGWQSYLSDSIAQGARSILPSSPIVNVLAGQTRAEALRATFVDDMNSLKYTCMDIVRKNNQHVADQQAAVQQAQAQGAQDAQTQQTANDVNNIPAPWLKNITDTLASYVAALTVDDLGQNGINQDSITCDGVGNDACTYKIPDIMSKLDADLQADPRWSVAARSYLNNVCPAQISARCVQLRAAAATGSQTVTGTGSSTGTTAPGGNGY